MHPHLGGGGGLGLVVSLLWPMISMRCPFGVTAAGELSVSQPREALLFQLQLTPTGKWPLKKGEQRGGKTVT